MLILIVMVLLIIATAPLWFFLGIMIFEAWAAMFNEIYKIKYQRELKKEYVRREV